jgi:hypothetical protein
MFLTLSLISILFEMSDDFRDACLVAHFCKTDSVSDQKYSVCPTVLNAMSVENI